MNYRKAKFLILWIFIIGLVTALSMAFLIKGKELMGDPNFIVLLKKLFAIYTVQLSVILATSFIENKKDSTLVYKPIFLTAFTLSIIWNLIILVRIVFYIDSGLANGSDDAPLLFSYLDNIPSSTSFLLAGVLAYFFSKND